MMKIQYQSEELIVFESALFRTTTSLIIGKDYVLLVDPNWLPIELDFIEKTVDSIGEEKAKYLLFTHSDYDHVIGFGKFKNYKTIASENFVKSASKDKVLKDIEKFDDENYVKREYRVEYPRIDMVISGDNEQITIGSEVYTFFQARGHNHDGLLTYNSTKHLLIAGDYLSNIEFPYIYDSIQLYLDTLSKFEKIITEKQVSILISGHGDITSNKAEMITRIKESREYIDRLTDSVTLNKVFNEKELFGKYDFPIIMKQFHLKNIEVAKKELKA